jgi:hypothetical protein
MEEIYIQIAAIISAVILMVIAIFQILLFLGFPLGEYSWGGKHKGVLPPLFRIMSLPSAILLFFMGFVFLIHTTVFSIGFSFVPTHSLVWIFTIFLGINTMGNFASKSKKEKLVMTPLSGIAFLSCLSVSIFSESTF